MRLALLLSAAVLGLPGAATARPHHGYARHHRSYAGGGYATGYYTNVEAHRVHRPERASGRPAGATARCRDDSWSFSENHRGTCSHHDGVARWL